jgi:hypothetical protein
MRMFMLLTATLVLGATVAAAAGADPGTYSPLTAIAGQGASLVEVAPSAR